MRPTKTFSIFSALATCLPGAQAGVIDTYNQVGNAVSTLRTRAEGFNGMGLVELYQAIKDSLKAQNAYDPDTPDKCVLAFSTTAGGNCVAVVDCGNGDKTWFENWGYCYLGGANYFRHPAIGQFAIQFTKAGGKNGDTQDGLHTPMLSLEDFNNWEKIDVQKIADTEPEDKGQLCWANTQQDYDQTWHWKCGIPRVAGGHATSAFGIALVPPDSTKPSYKGGWCTGHIIQYQKNEYGTGANYAFTIQLFDADKTQIANINHVSVNDERHYDMKTRLPHILAISAGFVDSDPITMCYWTSCWLCDNSAPHLCTLGQGKDSGYENGDREGDFGFTC